MSLLQILQFTVFTTIIVSWIWARYRFFRLESKASKISSYFYDPVAFLQVASTYYYSFQQRNGLISFEAGLILYIGGFSLFIWAIYTAKELNFAFSDDIGHLVTTGPYAFIRHPIYISYSLVWFSNALLFNSIVLWITLVYLVLFYLISAMREEAIIIKSAYSKEYEQYKKNVGMFLPRITQWIN